MRPGGPCDLRGRCGRGNDRRGSGGIRSPSASPRAGWHAMRATPIPAASRGPGCSAGSDAGRSRPSTPSGSCGGGRTKARHLRREREIADLGTELDDLGRRLGGAVGMRSAGDRRRLAARRSRAVHCDQAASQAARLAYIQEACRWVEQTPWSLGRSYARADAVRAPAANPGRRGSSALRCLVRRGRRDRARRKADAPECAAPAASRR